MSLFKRFFQSALIAPFLVATAHAVTLDWSSETWTAGSLNNSFDVDPANAGNDVTFAITGNTTQFGNFTPAINTNLAGGFGTAPSALNLYVDFASQAQSVTVSVTFSATYTLGVTNVSFTLFDIDGVNGGGSSFQDQLRSIIGIAPDGSQVAPTITLTGNTVDQISGTGVNQIVTGTANSPNTGVGSDAGNVTISFNSSITSFSFVYGSGTNTQLDPTAQQISIYNLAFTPVPEMNPTWSAVGSCLLAAVLILRHSAKFRK